MPDDLVLDVRQVTQYPTVAEAEHTDAILIQRGGLGGPYLNVTAHGLLVGGFSDPAGSYAIGFPVPADAAAAGLLATNVVTLPGCSTGFNWYQSSTGPLRYLTATGAGRWCFDGSTLAWQIAQPGVPGAPITTWSQLLSLNAQGDLEVSENEIIDGDLHVLHNLLVDGNAIVNGAAEFLNGISVVGFSVFVNDVSIQGNLGVDGNINASGSLDINGSALLAGFTTVNADFEVTGNGAIDGVATVGTLDVLGLAGIQGDAEVHGTLTVDGCIYAPGGLCQITQGVTPLESSDNKDIPTTEWVRKTIAIALDQIPSGQGTEWDVGETIWDDGNTVWDV